MSKLDKELLLTAGMNATEAANLLQRSRQAIYQGFSDPRRYFNAGEIITLLYEVIRRDSACIDALIPFIESNYTAEECDLILPDHVSRGQLAQAAKGSERVVMGFNGNIEHLTKSASFAKVLLWALAEHPATFMLVASDEWVRDYLAHELNQSPLSRFVISASYKYPLPFVLVMKQDQQRVFFFGRHSLAEAPLYTAKHLREHVQPMLN